MSENNIVDNSNERSEAPPQPMAVRNENTPSRQTNNSRQVNNKRYVNNSQDHNQLNNRYNQNKVEDCKSESKENNSSTDDLSRSDNNSTFNGASGGSTNSRGGKGGRYGNSGYTNNKEDREFKDYKAKADQRFLDKVFSIAGPTYELEPIDMFERKFQNKCRLYVGNMSADVTADNLGDLFRAFGESTEIFINKEKNFAFIRLSTRASAERARNELDGMFYKGRHIKVRFAPINAAIRVKCLSNAVTNELLELAFGIFGEIERAVVLTDERGNSKNEGIVEFTRKPAAALALKRCQEGVFFLTETLKPVIVEPYEIVDDETGLSEKTINKKQSDYLFQRQVGPRFASPGSFEYEFGTRWKQLYELYKQKEEALQKELKLEEEKLEAQMEYAKYENETEILREQLRQREIDRVRQKHEYEMKERHAEEQRRCDEEAMRRQTEEIHLRMQHQDEELRRRHQENSMFMQEHNHNIMRNSAAPAPPGYSPPGYSPPVDPLRDPYEAMAATGSIPAVMYLTLKNRENSYYY